jgi:putative endonuclease
MGYWVYILYSRSENVFYKGQTADLEDRCIRHNAGREKATAHAIPWVCLWATQKHSRSEALKLEKKLKNLSRNRTIQFMLKYRQDVAGPDELRILQQLSGC